MSGSQVISGSLTVVTGSGIELQVTNTGVRMGNVITDSHNVTGSLNVSGSITTTGTITAQTLVVQTITSSVDFVTGSTRFGSLLSNTHVFSGSVTMNPGGLFVSGSGLVGIGTSTPNFILDVKQATNQHFYVGPGIGVSGAIVLGGGNDAANANIPIEMRYATTFAFVDTGVERMRISGSNVGIGTTNIGSEANLHLGAFSANEGGQLILQRGTSYTSASHLDNYQNRFRILKGNDTSSTGETFSIDMNTGVVELPFGQLKFPSTQNPSSDANTLDDYEEGSWTPTLPNGGTLTLQNARYVKIGQKVTVTLYVSSVSPTNNASDFLIGGLPFANGGYSTYYTAGSFGYVATGNLNRWLVITGQNFNYIYFHANNGSTASRLSNANYLTDAGSDRQIILTITYFAA